MLSSVFLKLQLLIFLQLLMLLFCNIFHSQSDKKKKSYTNMLHQYLLLLFHRQFLNVKQTAQHETTKRNNFTQN